MSCNFVSNQISQDTPVRPTTTPLTSSWTSLTETQPPSPSAAAITKVRFENLRGFKTVSCAEENEFRPPSSLPDPESVLNSKRGIEDKLVEEYRNCHFYRQTKAELGMYEDEVTELNSLVPNFHNLPQQTVLAVFSKEKPADHLQNKSQWWETCLSTLTLKFTAEFLLKQTFKSLVKSLFFRLQKVSEIKFQLRTETCDDLDELISNKTPSVSLREDHSG